MVLGLLWLPKACIKLGLLEVMLPAWSPLMSAGASPFLLEENSLLILGGYAC